MNPRMKGFTVVELLIVVAIISIIGMMITGTGSMNSDGTVCKGGVLFSRDLNGTDQQVIGPNGGGVECGTPTKV